MSAEPLTREERNEIAAQIAAAERGARMGGVTQLAPYFEAINGLEATVQAVEALADHRLKALDGMHADLLKTQAEHDALARRVEALRAVLEGAEDFIERVAEWTGTDEDECQEVLDTITHALAADDEAAR